MPYDEETVVFRLTEKSDGPVCEYNGDPSDVARLMYVCLVRDGGGDLLKTLMSAAAMYLATFEAKVSDSMVRDLQKLIGVLRQQKQNIKEK